LLLVVKRVSYKNDNGTLRFKQTSASLRDATPAYRKALQFEYVRKASHLRKRCERSECFE